ncbi:MAG: V-type ATP synthase subunit D [Bacilli bacterium]|jgi:V/A-type H+/Na+-transporting ATPase subunit D|nr:V-type ATP synthase subunit D [Bacilli bacterium]
MALMNVNPTRMELSKLKAGLATSQRGHKLLKDKQDEMIRQFMLIIRENQSLRKEIEDELAAIMKKFSTAQLTMSYAGLMEALMVPSKSVEVTVATKNIMSIKTPTVQVANSEGDIDLTYGFAFTPSDLDGAILSLSRLLPKLLKLAELEKTCDMLAGDIEKTRRRVNAIEYIMIPDYEETIHFVNQKLDESDRSATIRLMKAKSLILAKEETERARRAKELAAATE